MGYNSQMGSSAGYNNQMGWAPDGGGGGRFQLDQSDVSSSVACGGRGGDIYRGVHKKKLSVVVNL